MGVAAEVSKTIGKNLIVFKELNNEFTSIVTESLGKALKQTLTILQYGN